MPAMEQRALTIPIQAVDDEGQPCGACLDSPAGPICAPPQPCGDPELVGPRAEIERLLVALKAGMDGALLSTVLLSLRIEPGEVELRLSVPQRCGGAKLADSAFQTLRRVLPDTDIYVTHAV
jgi:hypothetical protein